MIPGTKEEIVRAMDEVRFGPAGLSAMRPEGFGPSRVDLAITVPVYGRVPVGFFAWFSSLKARDAWEQKLLERCHFREVS